MNAHMKLDSGREVFVELNTPELGVDTVTLDTFSETGIYVEVDAVGTFLEMYYGDLGISLGQYRLEGNPDGDYFIYERKNLDRTIARGTCRLAALGSLLESFSE